MFVSILTDYLGAIEMGFSALGNMADTITKNIRALEVGEERLYQRGAWTYRLDPANRDQLRTKLKALLASADSDARSIISQHEDNFSSPTQITAGISLFYFEESEDS